MFHSFTAYGHPNISSEHKVSFEFTTDKFVTKTGDCIVGIKASFELEKLKGLMKYKHIHIELRCNGYTEIITAIPNPGFNSAHEIVVRKTDFLSERTLGIRSDKAASDFSPEFKKAIKEGNEIKIRIHEDTI